MSMASRPSYQPHSPHTWCGRRADPQRGQRLSDGAERVQAELRRLRDFALEVFFFGTAMMPIQRTRDEGSTPHSAGADTKVRA